MKLQPMYKGKPNKIVNIDKYFFENKKNVGKI